MTNEIHQDGRIGPIDVPQGSNALILKERTGLQPREHKFGAGENQRVWEIAYKDHIIGVNLGDIAQVPTEAVMCPTTPWLQVGGGAIENVLANAIGDELFDKYARTLMGIARRVHETEGFERAMAATELANLLRDEGGMNVQATPEQIATDIITSSEVTPLPGEGRLELALGYGAAIPAPSGGLSERGIKTVVLTNVTPDGSKPDQAGGMTREHMVRFTYNACMAAHMAGADSITIPSVGTGFAAAFGFGMSREDSIKGFVLGMKQFADELGDKTPLKRVDYNIYARPSEENARQVADLMRDLGVQEILRSHIAGELSSGKDN